MKEIPQTVSESTKRRNPHLFPEYTKREHNFDRFVKEFDKHHPPKPPKRIRQSTKPLMNKLEQEWLEVLKRRHVSPCMIYPQAIRFKLGNSVWYKPDFVVFLQSERIISYECKGPHAFRGGLENLKIASHAFPKMQWVLVWKEADEWKEQTVLA